MFFVLRFGEKMQYFNALFLNFLSCVSALSLDSSTHVAILPSFATFDGVYWNANVKAKVYRDLQGSAASQIKSYQSFMTDLSEVANTGAKRSKLDDIIHSFANYGFPLVDQPRESHN